MRRCWWLLVLLRTCLAHCLLRRPLSELLSDLLPHRRHHAVNLALRLFVALHLRDEPGLHLGLLREHAAMALRFVEPCVLEHSL